MADSSRSGRSLGAALASAVAANVAGVWLFLTMLDALPQLSQATGIRLSLAAPAIAAAIASAAAYEVILRTVAGLRRARSGDAMHVHSFTQAQLMLAASTGAGLMVGLIEQSTGPTESWGLLLGATIGAFWGFACGLLSATLVWVARRASASRRRRL